MKHPRVMLVALLATGGIWAQNAGVALSVVWGMIHGAGLGIVIAFVPLALGLTMLWAGTYSSGAGP